MNIEVIRLASEFADVWIATDNAELVNYSYGGTRLIGYQVEDFEVSRLLEQLTKYESALKNRLINRAIKRNVFATYKDSVPEGFMESAVGGARCLIRPRNEETASILSNPGHSSFQETIKPIFACIGKELDNREGMIKLTPDFGHFADLSDVLYEFTPHILGINRANGGCGGKTAYSSTGVIATLEMMEVVDDKSTPVTLIGAAGAMGSDILAYFCKEGFKNIAVCDLAYECGSVHVPADVLHLTSQTGMFTDASLERGGIIVATTIGQELENSHWQCIPIDAKLFLAHNLAIPTGQEGITLMRAIARQGVLALPGQMLTLGGALTSRLEWFWRQSRREQMFDKPMARLVVRELIKFLMGEIIVLAADEGITPYEAMLKYANME
jgi:hypothetical protein